MRVQRGYNEGITRVQREYNEGTTRVQREYIKGISTFHTQIYSILIGTYLFYNPTWFVNIHSDIYVHVFSIAYKQFIQFVVNTPMAKIKYNKHFYPNNNHLKLIY